MPKAQAVTPAPRATSAKQPASGSKTGGCRTGSKTAPPDQVELEPKSLSYVISDGTPTHVQMTIDDYEQLINRLMAYSAVIKLHDPDTKWISAKQFGLELAGQEIAEARKAAGLTQKQLGEKLGLPQSQISRIERSPDHTTVRTMKKIAKALGVDVSALIR